MSKQVKIGIAVVLLIVAILLIARNFTGTRAVRPGESIPPEVPVENNEPAPGGRFQAK